MGLEDHPSVRTINRILSREELTHRRTGRYESKGRKYPKLSAQVANEVHEMDYVGPCYLQGPIRFYSLNSVDLATGRCALSPVLSKAGQQTLNAIWSSWCRLGIPRNVQVDNELVFYGSRRYPRGMGILIRLRSEEHTSELQSPCNLVCRLLLEKKNTCVLCLIVVVPGALRDSRLPRYVS